MQNLTVTIDNSQDPKFGDQSKKFNLNFEISQSVVEYSDSNEARRSKVATKIFGFPWTQKVVVGTHYLIITKQDWVDWNILAQPLCGLIQEHFQTLQDGNPNMINIEENPMAVASHAPKTVDHPFASAVKSVIDTQINPMVAMHGGQIELIDVKDTTVYIQMRGGCQGCASSTATLRQGVEQMIKGAVPEIQTVVDVTDHSLGENPYYTA